MGVSAPSAPRGCMLHAAACMTVLQILRQVCAIVQLAPPPPPDPPPPAHARAPPPPPGRPHMCVGERPGRCLFQTKPTRHAPHLRRHCRRSGCRCCQNQPATDQNALQFWHWGPTGCLLRADRHLSHSDFFILALFFYIQYHILTCCPVGQELCDVYSV